MGPDLLPPSRGDRRDKHPAAGHPARLTRGRCTRRPCLRLVYVLLRIGPTSPAPTDAAESRLLSLSWIRQELRTRRSGDCTTPVPSGSGSSGGSGSPPIMRRWPSRPSLFTDRPGRCIAGSTGTPTSSMTSRGASSRSRRPVGGSHSAIRFGPRPGRPLRTRARRTSLARGAHPVVATSPARHLRRLDASGDPGGPCRAHTAVGRDDRAFEMKHDGPGTAGGGEAAGLTTARRAGREL